MDCAESRPLLVDLVYGELDAERQATVERHLASCPSCRDELAALRRTTETLDAWPPVEARCDPRLLAAVAAALPAETGRSPGRRVAGWLIGMAAGLLILVGLVALNAEIAYADGRLVIAVGRPASPPAELPPAIRALIRTELGRAGTLTLEAVEGQLQEWEGEQDARYAALVRAIQSARLEDRQRFAGAVEAVARGAAEDTRDTRRVLDGVLELVAVGRNIGIQNPDSMEMVP